MYVYTKIIPRNLSVCVYIYMYMYTGMGIHILIEMYVYAFIYIWRDVCYVCRHMLDYVYVCISISLYMCIPAMWEHLCMYTHIHL